MQRIDALGADYIEGIWRMTDVADGAVVAIERESGNGVYRIVMIDGPDRSVLPGTVIGSVRAAARKGQYQAELAVAKGNNLSKLTGGTRQYTLTLSDDGLRFVLEPHKGRWSTGVTLSIPLLLMRPRIGTNRVGRATTHGALRIYPRDIQPLGPVYL